MKLRRLLLAATAFAVLQLSALAQTVSYTGGTLTQSFDGMGPAGTNTPNGWFVGSNTTSSVAYTTNVSLNDGTIGINATVRGWNVGTSGDADRALGVSPTVANRYIEVRIMNATAMSIAAIDVHYDGEQWRTGNNATTTNVNFFEFSADGVNYVNMGTAFRFVQPVVSAATVALNGNDPANRVPNIGGSYTLPAAVGPNSIVYLRWVDVNDPNSDPLLALDNFSFSASLITQPVTLGITSPANNGIFPQSATIPVTTYATGTVESVAFYVDGNYVSTDSASPYTSSVPTTGLAIGNHTLTAVATNGNGVAVPATNSVVVQIVANQSPSVVISNSFSGFATGTVFLVGSGITNLVVASDDVAITNLEFYIDNVRTFNRAAVTNLSVANFLFIDVLPGVHQLKAIAYDNSGLTAVATRNITVTNPPSYFGILVPNGAEWNYLAGASEPALDANQREWYQNGFDDSQWASGLGELGAGDAANGYPERTQIDIGPTSNRYRTIYFRKKFVVDDPSIYQNLVLSVLFDDGYVVWLNGTSIWTNNIANVTTGITYTNFANGSPNEGTSYSVTNMVPGNLLLPGENTIAVEVHQVSTSSSDLSFDLMFWGEQATLPSITITGPTNGQTFPFGTKVAISASSSTFVTNAIFFVDGSSVFEDGTKPFSAIISNLSLGNHTLMVKGADEFGNVANSATVTISISSNSTPSVAIGLPANDTHYFVGTFALITNVTAADLDGFISRVDFYVDNRFVFSDTNNPYFVQLDDLTAGSHKVTAVAVDDSGALGSNSVQIVVTNPPNMTLLLTNGAGWKYLDDGTDQGTAWRQRVFDDSSWSNGVAEIGFGDDDANRPERTLVRHIVSGQTNVTFYFRTHFSVDNPAKYTNLILRLLRDDGGVVYINGQEVYRNNISANPVLYSTFANAAAADDGAVYQVGTTNTSTLLAGDNVVAVEMHQNSFGSSDISFDLMLWAESASTSPRLNAVLAGSQVTVTWQGSGYTLQQNNNLGNPNGWAAVPGNPQNTYQFTPPANQPALFFRLIK